MTLYRVDVKEVHTTSIYVEATDEDDARTEARDVLAHDDLDFGERTSYSHTEEPHEWSVYEADKWDNATRDN